ncbi:GPR1 [[Candida] subhashii]|uniref:GPR1 n=1 Tax=[Candida] subhashii TaxID=561895 RepID=A0A8J5QIB6_9ASCO|nr:GPR1 [[Candida] subhashii]KAG7662529.1 GPR1 [[Candida] subhashii]
MVKQQQQQPNSHNNNNNSKWRTSLKVLIILSLLILSLILTSGFFEQYNQQDQPVTTTSTTATTNDILIDTYIDTPSSTTNIPPPLPPPPQQQQTNKQYTHHFHDFIKSIHSIIIKRSQAAQNQIEKFTSHQVFVQRVLATSSSCASISACLTAMYFLFAIDPKRLVFRHHLIFFLLFFDLIKAIILLLYPTRVLTHNMSYYNERFCQAVGFFTATAIEGADIAILAFAVHTYLLIFKPALNTKVKNSTRIEGGLYRYRIYVYTLSIFLPLILASLAFVNGTGYASLVVWCYLPLRPLWYRMVLSWVPRYCIVIAIFVIYGFIYYHVLKEFKTLGGVFSKLHYGSNLTNEKPSLYNSLKFFLTTIKDYVFPSFVIPESQNTTTSTSATNSNTTSTTDGTIVRENIPLSNRHSKHEDDDEEEDDEELDDDDSSVIIEAPPRAIILPERSSTTNDNNNNNTGTVRNTSNATANSSNTENNTNTDNNNNRTDSVPYENPSLHQANLENFRKRQRIIQKQMKSIFVYPFAYCFIWLFPFILQVTQVNHEERYGPIYWINLLGAFMQPLNGFIDTLVFFFRERPWKYTVMRNFEKEHRQRVDNIILHINNPRHGSGHSFHHRGGTGAGDDDDDDGTTTQNRTASQTDGAESIHTMATNARIAKNSLSATSGLIDMNSYKFWRHYLNKYKFPLYKLPTEENIKKFQMKYIDSKLAEIKRKEMQKQAQIYVYNQALRQKPPSQQKYKLSVPINTINEKHLVEENDNPDHDLNPHDFSAVLLGGDNDYDFLHTNSTLGNFQFNNNQNNMRASSTTTTATTTTTSVNNKKLSKSKSKSIDMTDPLTKKQPVLLSTAITLPKKASSYGYTSTPISGKFSPFGDDMGEGEDSRNNHDDVDNDDDDDDEGELAFLEFLKKGPPV